MTNPFDPIVLGSLHLSNRFVRSATHDYFGNPDGTLSDREIAILDELARNKVGTIITALMSVSENGISEKNQNRIDDDRFIDRLSILCQTVHRSDAKLIVQLCHAGVKALISDDFPIPLGPSFLPLKDGHFAKALDTFEIDQIVEDFASAALRAKKAGADGVQVHGAHGYLLSQFLSPYENKRDDEYGGCAENRFRIIKRIIIKIQEVCGLDYPILIKLNSNLVRGNNTLEGENLNYLSDLNQWIKALSSLEVCAVELSGTGFSQFSTLSGPYFLELAKEIRKHSRIPLILVGGIKSISDIQMVLDSGIELVSMSRPFISDPDLLIKFESGKTKASCTSCNQCFNLPYTKNKRCIFDR
jgi:2,4-dienoyl-CoA reductase-like NADH-dependent reductase (Old Yellow Enzyme family)